MDKKKRSNTLNEFSTFSEPTLNDRVTIDLFVNLHDTTNINDKIYVVGNVNELGNWNVVKAKPLRKSNGRFKCSFEVPSSTNVEFKICKEKSWSEVEKGMFNEEISNHQIFAESNKEYNLEVYNWNN